jgi:hypothetical protein
MAELIQVIAQNGPLPIKTTATIETDAPTIITLAGSLWTPNGSQQIGIRLMIDGTPVQSASVFANSASMHLALVPMIFQYTFPWTQNQQHEFWLDYLTGGTTSDEWDWFLVTVQT